MNKMKKTTFIIRKFGVRIFVLTGALLGLASCHCTKDNATRDMDDRPLNYNIIDNSQRTTTVYGPPARIIEDYKRETPEIEKEK